MTNRYQEYRSKEMVEEELEHLRTALRNIFGSFGRNEAWRQFIETSCVDNNICCSCFRDARICPCTVHRTKLFDFGSLDVQNNE